VDEEFIRLLKEKDIIYIPTLMVSPRYKEVFAQHVELTPPELEIANPRVLSTLSDLKKLPSQDIPPSVRNSMKDSRPIQPDPVSLRNLKRLQEAGVTIAAGTDAGNIGTPHGPAIFREFELMEQAGLTPGEILASATLNGARLMGRQHEMGTIEEGKLADLVILDSNPLSSIRNTGEIHMVIKDGNIYRMSPKELLPGTAADDIRTGKVQGLAGSAG
jgi:imidazolonepropionase-like amidohydrolase